MQIWFVKRWFGECRSDSQYSGWETMKGGMYQNQKHNQKHVQNGYKHVAGRTLQFRMLRKMYTSALCILYDFRTEVPHTPTSTRPGFARMTSRS